MKWTIFTILAMIFFFATIASGMLVIVEIKSGNQLPIYDINKNKFIGFIHNAYFDCEKGELVFVSIKSGMLSSTKMVSSQDLSFGPDGLGTKTKEYLKVDTDKLKKYSKIIG